MKFNEIETLGKDMVNEILEERTRLLASTRQKEDKQETPILTFHLGEERYGVDVQHSLGIFPFAERTFSKIPGTPDFIAGIANLRGRIYSITDLAVFFGLAATRISDETHILLLSDTSKVIGILTDRKPSVEHRLVSTLESSQDVIVHGGKTYIKGIFQDLLIYLDSQKLLADPALIIENED